MKFKKGFLLLLLSIFFMTGCTNNTVSSKPKPEIKQVTTTNQKINGNRNQILNHDQFKKLFEQMHEYLKIGHFQLEASTLGSDFTIIDRELSFGKRKWLTVDGTSDSSSSQESLYFEDEKQTTQLSIHFAFTDHYIGEDMVQYPSNSGYNKLNQKLANKSDLIIISYKNIVISVQQNTLGKIDPETTQLAVKRIINELKQLK